MVSMMGGVINANVDELMAPTSEMNKSSRGIAAPRATENIRIILTWITLSV